MTVPPQKSPRTSSSASSTSRSSECEPPDTAAEPRNIERANLVHEDVRSAAGKFHLRPESSGHGLCRRRGDYDRRERREFVCLDDDGITTSALFATSPHTWWHERADITPLHGEFPSAPGPPRARVDLSD